MAASLSRCRFGLHAHFKTKRGNNRFKTEAMPCRTSRLTFPSGKIRKLEKSTGRSAEIAIYLPHNPADPPKTTNTSIRHMAFHGV